ncbi:MAG: nitroreductase family protein [Candidatus Omnitrophota bacterium]
MNEDKEINDTLSTIYSRKSVRRYSGEAVTREQLMELVKASMAAPTAVNKKPWAFVVITDKSVLAELEKELPHSRMIAQAGAAIIVCGVLEKALAGIEQEFWIQDCSAATENILLAAEAMKLGTVWTGVYPLPERIAYVQKTLGLPADVIPLNIIAVGHPLGADKPKDKFDSANIHWDRW